MEVTAVKAGAVTEVLMPLRETDVSAVVHLREHVAAEGRWIGEADPTDRVATATRLKAGIEDPQSGAYVAVVSSQVVGFVSIYDRHGCADLGMFVAHSHRGQGVGRRLLDAAIAWGRAAGCHKIALEVWPHNQAAIRLYQSAGFVIEGRRLRHHRRRDGTLWDSVEMGLVLDTTSPGCPY
ncbi:MAG: GNAT family N-acetyltransferase [Dietzia sp.]|nr:GNAT family N-acetyltransferase [Dietzia sp.]